MPNGERTSRRWRPGEKAGRHPHANAIELLTRLKSQHFWTSLPGMAPATRCRCAKHKRVAVYDNVLELLRPAP